MTAHVHQWLRDLSRARYTCATCPVIGYTPQNMPGQYRPAAQYITAYLCRAYVGDRKTGRHRCGAEAEYVTGDLTASRCKAHAPAKERAA